ncbi:MAG: hypothetical protein ACP6IY_11030 [Promethearchaeia archaeon]
MKIVINKSVAEKNSDFICSLCERKVNKILEIELTNNKVTIRHNFLYLCERCSYNFIKEIKEIWG